MDELLRALSQGSTATQDPTVLAAIITAIAVVLAAGVTTVAAFWPKHHGDDEPESLQTELLRRAREAERECRRLRAENTALRDHLLRADIDPSTGRSFRAPP